MTIDEYKKEVKQIRPQMLFIAQSYLRDNDEAEDVVQDVLLKLWQLLDTLRLPMSPLASVLVKNRCIDVLRRHRYMVEVKDSIVDEQQREDDRYDDGYYRFFANDAANHNASASHGRNGDK